MSTLVPCVRDILFGILTGVKDSLFGIVAIRKIHQKNVKESIRKAQRNQKTKSNSFVSSAKQPFNVYQKLFECCALNIGLFWFSIWIFNLILLPNIYKFMAFIFGQGGREVRIWAWLNPLLLYTFGAFWVLPLFVLSRLMNAFWFQDIAESTFRGRSQSSRSVSHSIADTSFSLIIEALFLIQAVLVGKLLYIGQIASIFHLSLLYSLYSFEYEWFYSGK